jgi:hypothetical protein
VTANRDCTVLDQTIPNHSESIFFSSSGHLAENLGLWQMSGAARVASDVIDVMGGDSETPGAGHCRPRRKRVKTAKAMEAMRQEDDIDWEEETA